MYTIREPFSVGLYFNAGPMRIPDTHKLTLAYIHKFKLPLNIFINKTFADIIYTNNIQTRLNVFENDQVYLNIRFWIKKEENGRRAND